MNRGLMELAEGASGKVKRLLDSLWMKGKEEEAIRLRGAISEKSPENERNRKTNKKRRGN